MLKHILRKAVTLVRQTVVIFAVLALVVSGASSAERAFSSQKSGNSQTKALSASAQLLPGPPSPEEIPRNMTPSGQADSEAYAYLSAVSLTDFSKSDSRMITDCFKAELISRDSKEDNRKSRVRTSASMICSRLAIQFTLVGAKPSGTS